MGRHCSVAAAFHSITFCSVLFCSVHTWLVLLCSLRGGVTSNRSLLRLRLSRGQPHVGVNAAHDRAQLIGR
eukprot:8945434-Pyramimonas_sp.AAC.1